MCRSTLFKGNQKMFPCTKVLKGLVASLALSVCITGHTAELIRKAYNVANVVTDNCDIDELEAIITCVVCPEEWDDVGGPGLIETTDDNRILIDQSAEIHDLVKKLLDTLEQFRTRAELAPPPKDRLQVKVSDGRLDKNKQQIVVYDVRHLVPTGNYDAVIEPLTKQIEPRTWDEVGAFGTCSPYESGIALVVLQTPVVHKKVSRHLDVPQQGK
jgi:hypothetical protein